MSIVRSAGLLLHPTSLPGPYGIGDLGDEAFRFADFLSASRIRIWQVLPLGPTGYGDSPYQSLSAFAGNPLLISPDRLVEDGLLSRDDCRPAPSSEVDRVDFGTVTEFKRQMLDLAYETFSTKRFPTLLADYEDFRDRTSEWLEPYVLYQALKDARGGREWTAWEPEIRGRKARALSKQQSILSAEIERLRFFQFLFDRQWRHLREYCASVGVQLMGDVAIFVAHDSADVWSRPEVFQLEKDGRPTVVAGVPPDYFSETGQLWGNPIYRWGRMRRRKFAWWIRRFRAAFESFDLIRVDHFRGFEAYWEVAGDAATAIHGQWKKVPGKALFEAVRAELGELPIVAENLGWITPGVESLRKAFGFPGMGILQFAFGSDPQASDFIPHRLARDVVLYTGTHDNDTTVGWWNSKPSSGSTRTADEIEKERDFARRYLSTPGTEIQWDFIRAAMASVARVAMVPVQDVLGLGSDARMNLPGKPDGNWVWRMRPGALTRGMSDRLHEYAFLYGRIVEEAAEKAPS